MGTNSQGTAADDLSRAKLFRDFSGTMLWQVLGKLFQVVGMVYATRCLGPDNIGVSRTIITLAMTLQLCLAFGLDTVAVRHVAKGTAKAGGIAPAIFTFRLVLGLVAAVLWAAGVWLSPLEGLERWTWLAGALFLLVLSLDYSWLFQATEQMPRASRFQLLSSVAASLWFILFFEKGQALGSDLFVLLGVNALVVGFVWWRMSRELGFRCLSIERLAKAGALFREARLIWAFNLSYFLLANMALPMTYFLLGKTDSGLFGSAQQLVVALQMFLHYFGIIMAPRLVVWRQADVAMFRRRVLLLAGGAAAAGLLFSGGLWLIVEWLYPLIFGEAYASAAGLLPVLVLGKFFAVGTAMFTWALWAEHRDKLPVLCCLPCCLVSGALYFWLLPIHGNTAAAWLTLGAESTLMLFSALAFAWAVRQFAAGVGLKLLHRLSPVEAVGQPDTAGIQKTGPAVFECHLANAAPLFQVHRRFDVALRAIDSDHLEVHLPIVVHTYDAGERLPFLQHVRGLDVALGQRDDHRRPAGVIDRARVGPGPDEGIDHGHIAARGGVVERRPVARREVPVVALGQVGPGGGELAHLGQVAGNGGVMQRWLSAPAWRPWPGAASAVFVPEIFVGVVERRPAAGVLRVDAEPGVEQTRRSIRPCRSRRRRAAACCRPR